MYIFFFYFKTDLLFWITFSWYFPRRIPFSATILTAYFDCFLLLLETKTSRTSCVCFFFNFFFFVDLFVALNVATFKNILCIPKVCKYFIFVVFMEIRKKNQSVIWGKIDIKSLLGSARNNEENNGKLDHNYSKLLCHWLKKTSSLY
jgi:hypothetical protein